MFPTGLFETATQRKILRVLAETNKRYTIAELAEMCHRSEATISRALRDAERYPFISKSRVAGSKQLTFRLDPESRYTAAIREFFTVEHDLERQNGTVPVDVWNLLEDVVDHCQETVDGFVELFLFGSYATGEYYAGSDIDLLCVHTGAANAAGSLADVAHRVGDDRLQIIPITLEDSRVQEKPDAELMDVIRARSPVDDVDVLIPLTGEVTA